MIRGRPNCPACTSNALAEWERFERNAKRADRFYAAFAYVLIIGAGVVLFRHLTGG